MNLGSTLQWFFVLILLTSCAKTELPVNVAETLSPTALPTESLGSTADLLDSKIDITSLSGKILFSAEGDIFVINADGTGRTQITDHPAEDFDPVWSPRCNGLAANSFF